MLTSPSFPLRKVTNVRTSQQTAVVEQPPLHTASFIEAEEQLFKRLSDLAQKERISLKILTSELLKAFLILHKREVKQCVENIKRRSLR